MEILKRYKNDVDNFIEKLSNIRRFPDRLNEALFYTPKSGGKRIRAMLVMLAGDIFNADRSSSITVASSIELIHAYSLIHDDLPAMDNDDFRRGKPSNHKVFGEAIAILAGDSLNTYAFELIANASSLSDKQRVDIIRVLSNSAGLNGMAVGQAADILSSDHELEPISRKWLVNYIHKHKTAKLIQASVVCGALCGLPDNAQLNKIRQYGLYTGVAFQIIDDYLDIVGDEEKMGKKKVDAINNTLTYPRVYGVQRSLDMANKLKEMAIDCIVDIPKSQGLIKIAKLIIERDR